MKTALAGHDDSTVTILFALGANVLIALAKGIAALVTGSSAMLAEAVHSLADCGNQGLLLLGLKRSARPPDADYPLGHGRAIYFWSFIVALMLFSMGGMFSIYEGMHKMGSGRSLEHPWIAIAVLALSLAAESVSLWKALTQVSALRGSQSLWRWFRETRRSELLVVVGEDIAATLGLSLALLAVGAAMLTGNPAYDALGSLAIGVLLLVVAALVGIEVKALLVGQSAEPALQEEVRRFLLEREEVAEVLNLITLQNGADVVVAVKARMTEGVSAPALVDAINRCERDLRAAFPQVRWLFFEPDVEK
ncbi:MAG TPA: cation diffusion facilitator family transporter [Burkholderiales bacterium]|nr:cation diffusion facilitator family transporter [Burkholderiales bacterium]